MMNMDVVLRSKKDGDKSFGYRCQLVCDLKGVDGVLRSISHWICKYSHYL